MNGVFPVVVFEVVCVYAQRWVTYVTNLHRRTE